MIGFAESFLRAVSPHLPAAGVVVIEEPDLIRKRGLDAVATRIPCVDRVVPGEYQQSDACLAIGRALAEERAVAALMPGTEYAVPATAALAEALDLPGAGGAAAEILRDKLRLRTVTAGAGLRNPEFREVTGPADVVAFAAGRPIVVKPSNRQASVGVYRLVRTGIAEATAAWTAMATPTEAVHLAARSMTSRYLAEAWLGGREYSVEALVEDGSVLFENVTEKNVIAGVHPVEAGHLVPASASRETAEMLSAATRRLIDVVGFRTGILHAEWMVGDDGPALVECAGRCPGDRIMDLIDLAYGTNLRLAVLELLRGKTPKLPDHPVRHATIRYLRPKPGVVTSISGIAEARELAGVRHVDVSVEVGDTVVQWRSSYDRPGFVLAALPEAESVRSSAEEAARTVRIETRPLP
jgi:biotin carboxylase